MPGKTEPTMVLSGLKVINGAVAERLQGIVRPEDHDEAAAAATIGDAMERLGKVLTEGARLYFLDEMEDGPSRINVGDMSADYRKAYSYARVDSNKVKALFPAESTEEQRIEIAMNLDRIAKLILNNEWDPAELYSQTNVRASVQLSLP